MTAVRPGEWMQIDSTPLDVRVVLDDGTGRPGRADLDDRHRDPHHPGGGAAADDQGGRRVAAAGPRADPGADAARLAGRAADVPVGAAAPAAGWTLDERLAARGGPAGDRPGDDRLRPRHGLHVAGVPRPPAGRWASPCSPPTRAPRGRRARSRRSFASVGIAVRPVRRRAIPGPASDRRGKNADDDAAWSMAELQDLLDEWIVAHWQNRPARRAAAPADARQGADPERACMPPWSRPPDTSRSRWPPSDYIELLPVTWRMINAYGVKISHRTYDCKALNPYRRQHSGVERAARALGSPLRPLRRHPDLGPQPPRRRLDPGAVDAPADGPGARSASRPGTRPGRCSPAAARTRPPRPRSPAPPPPCSTRPEQGPPRGREERRDRKATARVAARTRAARRPAAPGPGPPDAAPQRRAGRLPSQGRRRGRRRSAGRRDPAGRSSTPARRRRNGGEQPVPDDDRRRRPARADHDAGRLAAVRRRPARQLRPAARTSSGRPCPARDGPPTTRPGSTTTPRWSSWPRPPSARSPGRAGC